MKNANGDKLFNCRGCIRVGRSSYLPIELMHTVKIDGRPVHYCPKCWEYREKCSND